MIDPGVAKAKTYRLANSSSSLSLDYGESSFTQPQEQTNDRIKPLKMQNGTNPSEKELETSIYELQRQIVKCKSKDIRKYRKVMIEKCQAQIDKQVIFCCYHY